jgi:hypothetical protein
VPDRFVLDETPLMSGVFYASLIDALNWANAENDRRPYLSRASNPAND